LEIERAGVSAQLRANRSLEHALGSAKINHETDVKGLVRISVHDIQVNNRSLRPFGPNYDIISLKLGASVIL
jgi:hypothetical protein